MSQIDKVMKLIGQTTQAIEKAKVDGNDSALAKLEELKIDLIIIGGGIALMDVTQAAAELAALTARLEKATKEIESANGSFYLGNLENTINEIRNEADKIAEETKPIPAVDNQPPPPTEVATGAATSLGNLSIPPTKPNSYVAFYKKVEFRSGWKAKADAAVDQLVRPDASARYRRVEELTGVPWWVTAVIHMMESSQRFNAHLHNGDPLTAPTVRVPRNRPSNWHSAMTWEESAADALSGGSKRWDEVEDWSLGNALMLMEKYNGLGYRTRKRMSPYLWSGSNHFEKGKYVRDGKFDPEATSAQVGGALLIRRLVDRGFLSLSSNQAISSKPAAVLGSDDLAAVDYKAFVHAEDEVEFPLAANSVIRIGAGGSGASQKKKKEVRRVQEWCCLHKKHTSIDGEFGPSTRDGVKLFQQASGLPVTGEVDRQTWTMLTAPMRRAIAPVDRAGSLNDAALAVAKQHLEEVPKEVGGNNCGPWVRLYMKGQEGIDQRWCAGFVCSIVAQASSDLGQPMPFDRQVGVDQLVSDAKNSGRFVAESSISNSLIASTKIVPGTLFVIRKSSSDWNHVGFVTSVETELFRTIEGNTNGANVDGGNAIFSSRSFKKKDFLTLV